MPTRLIACLIAVILVLFCAVAVFSQDGPPAPPMPPGLADDDAPPGPPMPVGTADDGSQPPAPPGDPGSGVGPPAPPGLPPGVPGVPPAQRPPRQGPPRPPTNRPTPPPVENATTNNDGSVGEITPLLVDAAEGRNSPMFKGNPAHTGYFDELLGFPLKLSWKFLSEVSPDNPSSPAVKDGVIYFGAGSRLYAVNAETGSMRWRYPATESLTATIRTSPAVGDGMVYFGAGDGRLYAVSTDDGSLVWNFVTRSNITSSPVLVDGVVYFGSDDRSLYALDAKTGAMKWPGGFRTKDGIASSPAVADGLIYFLSTDTILYAASTISTRLSWATRIGSGSRQTTPIVADNTLYLAAGHLLYALQSKSARVKWAAPVPGEITTTPAVSKGVIYFAFKEGKSSKFVAFTSAGKLKWKEPVDLGSPSYSSPIVTEDTVIVTANKGLILALDKETGAVRWKYTIQPSILEYGSTRYKYRYVNLVAAPVVVNGTLYVLADDGALHAFSMSSPDTTPPRVETVRPLRNFLMPGTPPVEISALVKDLGSGIREDTIKLTLDGETLDHHVIPERGVIWYKTPRSERLVPLSNGRHTATLTVEDWAGNRTLEEWTFMVDNTLRTAPQAKPGSSTTGGSGGAGGMPTEAPPVGF
ncbi:MAG: PQQ-binding-like beta-propeller repeat protein [Armatimonadetes bacterium]|nr:PQQ-binding-like beta-propeller repeat protein [Armatimonadota bacterium]